MSSQLQIEIWKTNLQLIHPGDLDLQVRFQKLEELVFYNLKNRKHHQRNIVASRWWMKPANCIRTTHQTSRQAWPLSQVRLDSLKIRRRTLKHRSMMVIARGWLLWRLRIVIVTRQSPCQETTIRTSSWTVMISLLTVWIMERVELSEMSIQRKRHHQDLMPPVELLSKAITLSECFK